MLLERLFFVGVGRLVQGQRRHLHVVGVLLIVHDADDVGDELGEDEVVNVAANVVEEEPVAKLALAVEDVELALGHLAGVGAEDRLAEDRAVEGHGAVDELDAGDDGEDDEPEPDEDEAARQRSHKTPQLVSKLKKNILAQLAPGQSLYDLAGMGTTDYRCDIRRF